MWQGSTSSDYSIRLVAGVLGDAFTKVWKGDNFSWTRYIEGNRLDTSLESNGCRQVCVLKSLDFFWWCEDMYSISDKACLLRFPTQVMKKTKTKEIKGRFWWSQLRLVTLLCTHPATLKDVARWHDLRSWTTATMPLVGDLHEKTFDSVDSWDSWE